MLNKGPGVFGENSSEMIGSQRKVLGGGAFEVEIIDHLKRQMG